MMGPAKKPWNDQKRKDRISKTVVRWKKNVQIFFSLSRVATSCLVMNFSAAWCILELLTWVAQTNVDTLNMYYIANREGANN